jgi:hypothetical protein
MNKTMIKRISPPATSMIRMDHTHVMATFHRYRIDASPDKKLAVANTICAALEIHAKLEEEIFYPAMRRFDPDLVDKSVPEHNEVRRLIARLRELSPGDASYDAAVMELMRNVMRHVADEETMLLPDAERALGAAELADLGARMTRRRFELAGPRAGEIAVNTVRTFPGITLAVSGVVALAAFLAGWALMRPTGARRAFAVPNAVRKLAAPGAIRKLARPNRLRALTSRITAIAH